MIYSFAEFIVHVNIAEALESSKQENLFNTTFYKVILILHPKLVLSGLLENMAL